MPSKIEIYETFAWNLVNVIKQMCDQTQSPSGPERNPCYYPFIPFFDISLLVKLFSSAKKHLYKKGRRHPKFLDVGCGPGTIVVLAKVMGFNPYGIDYMDKYVELAKTAIGAVRVYNSDIQENIIKADATTFKRYNEFDVIYYYVPIAAGDIMHKLYVKIMKEMKVGSLFIPMSYGDPKRALPGFFDTIDQHVPIYEKLKKIPDKAELLKGSGGFYGNNND
jgi:hypothetical protein